MPLTATAAVGVAAALDRLFAEPPAAIHPVALFGRLVTPLDRAWPAPRAAGALLAVGLPLLVAGAGVGTVVAADRGATALVGGLGGDGREVASVAAATLAAALVLFSTTSLRMLLTEARRVATETERDLDVARRTLRALAGRNADALSAGEVRSATIESAAENLADGLVAPLGAFAVVAGVAGGTGVPSVIDIGSATGAFGSTGTDATTVLAPAAGAAAWVKAVNTLDSMLGYREKPVGWAAARLDDLVMWLPARTSALLLALAAADPGALGRGRTDARTPASPNSGWPMATLAEILGVRLEKPGHYALDGGDGSAALPTVGDAERGVRLVRRAGLLAVAAAGVIAWL